MPTEPKQPAALIALIRDCLVAGGFTAANSDIVARHLVDAEMKGVSSHGVNRLGLYLGEAAKDVIDPKAEPVVTKNVLFAGGDENAVTTVANVVA